MKPSFKSFPLRNLVLPVFFIFLFSCNKSAKQEEIWSNQSKENNSTIVKIKPNSAALPDVIDAKIIDLFYLNPQELLSVPGQKQKDGYFTYCFQFDFPQSILFGQKEFYIPKVDTLWIDYTDSGIEYKSSPGDTCIKYYNQIDHGTFLINGHPIPRTLSPKTFLSNVDSIYLQRLKEIDSMFTKHSNLDEEFRYYAEGELLFLAGKIIHYYTFHHKFSLNNLEIKFPPDFFKYNDIIAKNYTKPIYSLAAFNYFISHHMHIVSHYSLDEYNEFIEFVEENYSGLFHDISLGMAISQYQLRIYNKDLVAESISYAKKIDDKLLRNRLLTRINNLEQNEKEGVLTYKYYNKQGSLEEILKPYKRKIVLVKFWAIWCGPCLREASYMDELSDLVNNDKFKILNICASSPYSKWKEYLESNDHFGEHIYLNDEDFKKIQAELEVPHFPFYVIANQKNKKIIMEIPRPVNWNDFSINENLIKIINQQLK